MGSCYSAIVSPTTGDIEMKLCEAEREDDETKKILFLGPGGSGKSTIFKQLQWLHLNGFNDEGAKNLKRHVYAQTISQMKSVIKYYEMKEEFSTYDDIKLEDAISTVKTHVLKTDSHFDEQLAKAIKYIWHHDNRIKNVFHDTKILKYQLLDETTQQFWDDIDRISAPLYLPNDDDILNVRLRTTGVVEKDFELQTTRFHICDLGGQKSERRKWIHFFKEVDAVLFVISLSCYDQVMFQDMNTNCMMDSLQLFQDIVNNKEFTDTHMILFLNKKDLFEKKIVKIPITVCEAFSDFDEYDHGSGVVSNANDFEQTTAYIRDKFKALNKNKDRQIYSHFTYALDRKNIDRVFTDVHRIIVSSNFAMSCMA